MPIEASSSTRRAFLTGGLFTRKGREQLALDFAEQGRPLAASVSLDARQCLGWQQITCVSCRDACARHAINLVANLEPQIYPDLCNGCGLCAPVCPAGAIRIQFGQRSRG